MRIRYTCPVCGYPDLTDMPRTESGGSYEICWSCGFEFGVTDDDLGYSYETWRDEWILRGMPWASPDVRTPPPGWDPAKQLSNVVNSDEP
jgi:hypothetical protein